MDLSIDKSGGGIFAIKISFSHDSSLCWQKTN